MLTKKIVLTTRRMESKNDPLTLSFYHFFSVNNDKLHDAPSVRQHRSFYEYIANEKKTITLFYCKNTSRCRTWVVCFIFINVKISWLRLVDLCSIFSRTQQTLVPDVVVVSLQLFEINFYFYMLCSVHQYACLRRKSVYLEQILLPAHGCWLLRFLQRIKLERGQ